MPFHRFSFSFERNEISLQMGEYDFEQEGETLSDTYHLESMTMHENYNPRTFENDIALLKTDRPVQINKSIYPICLPPRTEQFTRRRAYVIGWGTIYFGGPTSSTVQEVNVEVWDNSQCAANYGKLNRQVTNTMLCAGADDKDACQVREK